MIHILDQYRAAGTYDYGGGGQVAYSTARTLYDSDMHKIVAAYIKAHKTKTGYTAMYNLFIKKRSSRFSGKFV